jgi:hypothetical protein
MRAGRAASLAAAVAASALASGACAPLASFRPASGIMPGRTLEVGAGGVLEGPRPYVTEPTRATGQLWASGRADEKLTLTGIVAFDASALALGGSARIDLVRADRFAAGVEPELGLLWAALDVPIALRLYDETWVYTAPRFGTRGLDWALTVPVGVSVRVYDGLMLRAEYGTSWSTELTYFQRRDLFGVALALQY